MKTAYSNALLPISPSFFTATIIVLPIIYIFMYQYFSTWTSFTVANVVIGAVLAFVIEPLLRWLHVYQYLDWNSFFAFLVYIGMGMIVKAIVNALWKAQNGE